MSSVNKEKRSKKKRDRKRSTMITLKKREKEQLKQLLLFQFGVEANGSELGKRKFIFIFFLKS